MFPTLCDVVYDREESCPFSSYRVPSRSKIHLATGLPVGGHGSYGNNGHYDKSKQTTEINLVGSKEGSNLSGWYDRILASYDQKGVTKQASLYNSMEDSRTNAARARTAPYFTARISGPDQYDEEDDDEEDEDRMVWVEDLKQWVTRERDQNTPYFTFCNTASLQQRFVSTTKKNRRDKAKTEEEEICNRFLHHFGMGHEHHRLRLRERRRDMNSHRRRHRLSDTAVVPPIPPTETEDYAPPVWREATPPPPPPPPPPPKPKIPEIPKEPQVHFEEKVPSPPRSLSPEIREPTPEPEVIHEEVPPPREPTPPPPTPPPVREPTPVKTPTPPPPEPKPSPEPVEEPPVEEEPAEEEEIPAEEPPPPPPPPVVVKPKPIPPAPKKTRPPIQKKVKQVNKRVSIKPPPAIPKAAPLPEKERRDWIFDDDDDGPVVPEPEPVIPHVRTPTPPPTPKHVTPPPEPKPVPQPRREPRRYVATAPKVPKKRWGAKPKKDTSLRNEMARDEIVENMKKRVLLLVEKSRSKYKMMDGFDDEGPCFQEFGFLAKYCILNRDSLTMYKRLFEAADKMKRKWLTKPEAMAALRQANPFLEEKEEEYMFRVMEVCDYDVGRGADFKLFAVLAALSQKITSLDEWMRNMIGTMDFKMLDLKAFMCRHLWECNVDRDTNTISIGQLCVELQAGGVTEEHVEEVRQRLGWMRALDLLDFLTYIPLFIKIHSQIILNPLERERTI